MTFTSRAQLGSVLLFALVACSEPQAPQQGDNPQQPSQLVSIRVAGFVEAAGIT